MPEPALRALGSPVSPGARPKPGIGRNISCHSAQFRLEVWLRRTCVSAAAPVAYGDAWWRNLGDQVAARSTGQWVEDPLTLAVQIMHDAVAVLDMAGRVLVVNDRLLAMTGFTRSDLIGASWATLIPEHDLPDPRLGFVSVSRRAAEEGSSSEGAAVNVARKDGSTFSGNLVTSPLVSPQHGPVVVVAIGSVRKLTLEEIGFRGLLESAPDATIVLDARCRVVLGNSRAATLFGRPRNEL